MHFDLFYELSLPPGDPRSEAELYRDALDELALADALGYRTAWLVEHHFMPGYSHSSAPETFLAAASQRSRRLRLGHAIVPLPYSHPVRVAERLASLDVLSNGRMEFGYGRGFSPQEYASFGAEMKHSRSLTQEALDIVRLSFGGEPVSYQGQHFQLEDIDIVPKVVQRPHPPIWSAAVSPESFELAAEQGVGVLVGPFKPWFMVKEDIKRYRRAWQNRHGDGPPAAGLNNRVGMTVGIFCLEDAHQAHQQAKPAFEWFYHNLLSQTRPILQKLYDSYEYYKRMGHLHTLLSKTIRLKVLETMGMAIVGDPAHCVHKLKKLQKAGVDHVLLAVGAGALPSEQVQASLRLIAERVMPHFR